MTENQGRKVDIDVQIRYKEYMDPQHPDGRKAILIVNLDDIPINDLAKSRFIDIVGRRYNPLNKSVKITVDK